MVKFVFSDAKEWRHIVESLAVIVEEANFIITPESLRLRALSPSKVSMVDLELPCACFETFSCERPEATVGINFDEFDRILKRSRSDEKVEIEVSEGRIKVRIAGRSLRTFALPIMDLGVRTLPVPRHSPTVRAKLYVDDVRVALKDVELISESVKFRGDPDAFIVEAHSDRGDVNVKFSEETGSLIEYEVKEPATSIYGVKSLIDMLSRASALSDLVTMEFATNRPIAITFEVALGGTLRYFLAPRLEA